MRAVKEMVSCKRKEERDEEENCNVAAALKLGISSSEAKIYIARKAHVKNEQLLASLFLN